MLRHPRGLAVGEVTKVAAAHILELERLIVTLMGAETIHDFTATTAELHEYLKDTGAHQ